MVAVLGSTVEIIEKILKDNEQNFKAQIANDNSEGQIVLSGKMDDLDKLIKILKENAIKNIKLPVSAPFHCSLMSKATEIMTEELNKLSFKDAENKLISLTLDDETAVPIGGEPIYLSDQIIGQTTSCAFGFRIGKPIALGHLKEMVSDNSTVYVDIARQLYSARVSIGPLFDADGLRMKS